MGWRVGPAQPRLGPIWAILIVAIVCFKIGA